MEDQGHGSRGAASGAWYPDPGHRYQYRFHDGERWTDHVANGGQVGSDPYLGSPLPPAQEAQPAFTAPGVQPGWQQGTYPASHPAGHQASLGQLAADPQAWAGQQHTPPGGVTFGGAISRCFGKYAVFTGRAPRSEFWWFALFQAGVIFLAAFLGALVAVGDPDTADAIVGFAVLALILPQLAVGARRLHDTGKSGWWQAISLIPLFGGIALIVLMTALPEPGPNKWGPAV